MTESLFERARASHLAGRTTEAEMLYNEAVAADPRCFRAFNNLGTLLEGRGALAEAEACYRRGLEVEPGAALLHYNLGHVLHRRGHLEEAIEAYRAAAAIEAGREDVSFNLARALLESGREGEAPAVLEPWLARDPENATARFLLAAFTGEAPDRAPDAFVREHFDAFAATFDTHLRSLDYRTPELLEKTLLRLYPEGAALDLLDAGCGTGLCASRLSPFARTLAGVDLSPAMLAKAETLGIYDRLVEAELTAFLREEADAFDLIVSADTLVYFGDLAPPLDAAAGALRPGGRFLFTLECGSEPAYGLEATGRYRHSRRYIEETASAAGLAPLLLESVVLRKEAGEPVSGWLVASELSPSPEAPPSSAQRKEYPAC